jgi:nucleoside-diphosphate-sugar epimerase
MPNVIILGAKGRFGRAALTAFVDAGWDVTAFARAWDRVAHQGATLVTGDATDPRALCDACAGFDVIVNAINPAYENWARDLPRLTSAMITAARQSGATVMIPGNVYNYGANAPDRLDEETLWLPTSRKGQLRVEMEKAYRAAGVRTIILRAGDFIEREKSGNWFDSYITAKAHQGRTMYPGPLDQVHAWAYLPDMARAAVELAERREDFATFEQFGFEGYALTGEMLVEEIGKAVGAPQKTSGLPWGVIGLLGLFRRSMREIHEMRYLWRVPHHIDGGKLARTLPQFKATPVEAALREVLRP